MMRKALLAMILVCGMSASLSAAPLEILIAYENREQPPYYMGNTSKILLPKPGVAVEMVMRLEKWVPNLRVSLSRHLWQRCKKELQNGRVDGIFNASFKPERLRIGAYPMENGKVDPSRRITTISYSLYKLRTSPVRYDGKNVINLKGVIGAPRGYSIVGDLKKKGAIVEESDATALGHFKNLLSRRVRTLAMQDVTADALLKKRADQFKDVVKISPPLATKPYYLMLSHKFVNEHPVVAEKIWDAIAKIREEEMDSIVRKYAE